MDNGGIEPGWTPPPPPAIGEPKWKDNMAFQQALGMLGAEWNAKSRVIKLRPCLGHDLGYLAIRRVSGGTDTFRVDSIEDILELANVSQPQKERKA